MTRNSLDLELEVGAGDVAGEVRPEVALLDDLVELRQGLRSDWSASAMPPWPAAAAGLSGLAEA